MTDKNKPIAVEPIQHTVTETVTKSASITVTRLQLLDLVARDRCTAIPRNAFIELDNDNSEGELSIHISWTYTKSEETSDFDKGAVVGVVP